MGQVFALSLSISILGGVWAYLALGPLHGFVLVWAGFVGWGCFFHAGADQKALVKTIVGNAYGALLAWAAFMIMDRFSFPELGTAWPAIVVGGTVFFLVIVAQIDALSAVPANVYGYAAFVAYVLHQPSPAPDAGPLHSLLAKSFDNPLILLIASLALGAVFGWVSALVAGVLTRKKPAEATA